MKAWLLDKFERVSHLRLAEVPDPQPGSNEVLLRVHFAALNPADRYLAEGKYPARPALPHVLGRDGVGTIVKVGEGIGDLKPGDRRLILRGDVGVSRPGTLAELVAVPVDSLVELPSGWTEEESAAAPLVYLTAYQALTQWGDLPPSVVLVTGASGGVGVATTQLGVAMGHTIVALSRSQTKRRQLEKIGAAITLDPEQADWPKTLKDKLNGRKVDLAVDNIGGELFSQVLSTLGNFGKVSVVGALAGPVSSFNTATLFFRRLRVGGVAVGAFTASESQEAWGKIVAILRKTGAKPLIDCIFPFDQVQSAFERLHEGPMGKVLVRVR
jgi:NADPH2:quinone reductase